MKMACLPRMFAHLDVSFSATRVYDFTEVCSRDDALPAAHVRRGHGVGVEGGLVVAGQALSIAQAAVRGILTSHLAACS